MPKVVDVDEKRREIIAAAVRLIADEGFGSATMRRVAKEVGCTTGQVTHYFANREEIQQILVNLLLNAADATPPEGTVTLSIRSSANGEAVEIEVRDTGHGLAPELSERIFDPYFTTRHDGTGLGLTIARRIAEAHGGTLDVVSHPGDGARFCCTLPLTPR